MWIAIMGVFVLVTVLFGQSPHRESKDGINSSSARRL